MAPIARERTDSFHPDPDADRRSERIAVANRGNLRPATTYQGGRDSRSSARSLHRTTIMEAILIILDDGRDSVKRIAAIGILCGIL